jgi:hypothetical protein
MEFINYNLLKHPANWVIVFMMVFIAGIAIHLFISWNKGAEILPKINSANT